MNLLKRLGMSHSEPEHQKVEPDKAAVVASEPDKAAVVASEPDKAAVVASEPDTQSEYERLAATTFPGVTYFDIVKDALTSHHNVDRRFKDDDILIFRFCQHRITVSGAFVNYVRLRLAEEKVAEMKQGLT